MRRLSRWLIVACVIVAVSACGSESAAEACQRGPLFSSARLRAERAVTELERTTSLELQESVSAIVDQILVMREVSPGELRDPLGVLLAAYGQLVVAFEDIAWNPGIAMTDSDVATARAAFAETSVSQATEDVETFYSEQCDLAISQSDPLFAASATTLPLPAPSDEPRLDAAETPTVDPTELQALGFLLGEKYGVALVAQEAECIARTLGSRFSNASDIDLNDAEFFTLVSETFVSCGVTTTPSTTPNN